MRTTTGKNTEAAITTDELIEKQCQTTVVRPTKIDQSNRLQLWSTSVEQTSVEYTTSLFVLKMNCILLFRFFLIISKKMVTNNCFNDPPKISTLSYYHYFDPWHIYIKTYPQRTVYSPSKRNEKYSQYHLQVRIKKKQRTVA
jgi:hypothetical protein